MTPRTSMPFGIYAITGALIVFGLSCREPPTYVVVSFESGHADIQTLARLEVTLTLDGASRTELFHPLVGELGLPTSAVFEVAEGRGSLEVSALAAAAPEGATLEGRSEVALVAGKTAKTTVRLQVSPVVAPPERDDAGTRPDDIAPDDVAPLMADARPIDAADAQTPAPVCLPRTRQIVAGRAVGIDYGLDPKLANVTGVVGASRGYGKGHQHDVVAWFHFALSDVPATASFRSARLRVNIYTFDRSPTPILEYSQTDGWTIQSGSGDVQRTALISKPFAAIERGGLTLFEVDSALYESYWRSDVTDRAATVGLSIAGSLTAPERNAWFTGVASPLPPTLELETCE